MDLSFIKDLIFSYMDGIEREYNKDSEEDVYVKTLECCAKLRACDEILNLITEFIAEANKLK